MSRRDFVFLTSYVFQRICCNGSNRSVSCPDEVLWLILWTNEISARLISSFFWRYISFFLKEDDSRFQICKSTIGPNPIPTELFSTFWDRGGFPLCNFKTAYAMALKFAQDSVCANSNHHTDTVMSLWSDMTSLCHHLFLNVSLRSSKAINLLNTVPRTSIIYFLNVYFWNTWNFADKVHIRDKMVILVSAILDLPSWISLNSSASFNKGPVIRATFSCNLSCNNVVVASWECLLRVVPPSRATTFHVAESRCRFYFLQHKNLLRGMVVKRATNNLNFQRNIFARQVALNVARITVR